MALTRDRVKPVDLSRARHGREPLIENRELVGKRMDHRRRKRCERCHHALALTGGEKRNQCNWMQQDALECKAGSLAVKFVGVLDETAHRGRVLGRQAAEHLLGSRINGVS